MKRLNNKDLNYISGGFLEYIPEKEYYIVEGVCDYGDYVPPKKFKNFNRAISYDWALFRDIYIRGFEISSEEDLQTYYRNLYKIEK